MKDPFLMRKIVFIAIAVSFSACLQVFSDGWIHYVLNMLAFACLPFIFPRVKGWHFVALLLLLPPLISLSFYYGFPEIEAYAGLSGVLHGAYAAVASVHLLDKKERNFAVLVLFLLLAKLIWENTIGSVGTAELIGSPVLVEAHLLGVIWGVMIAIIYILWLYFYRWQTD